MGPPKPRGILVKRSVSEGPSNKDHDHELSHHRQSSLSLRHVSNNANLFTDHSKDDFRGIVPRNSMHAAGGGAVKTQSGISSQRRLRIMNAEWSDEEEAAVSSVSSFEPAVPRRTVSFAPIPETQQLSISETSSLCSSIRHPKSSPRADLPRILQAGVRPDTPAQQSLRGDRSAPTPRQLALSEEEELGADGLGQGGDSEQPLGPSEEAHVYVQMLDDRMKEIASKGTWSKPSRLGHATPGYVATMRRQQYADAHTSFRRPERGLSQSSCELRPCSLAHFLAILGSD